jgi:hypothetical protein
MADSLSINDDSISVVLNDANTLFFSLSDTFSFDDSVLTRYETPNLTDSLSISESLAYGRELSLYDEFIITDLSPFFTGLLFQSQSLTATLAVNDDTYAATERESVFETGDYGDSAVFVITDLANIGVFE